MILDLAELLGMGVGHAGALLAVPLLIIIQTVLNAAGKPDIAGFLFEHGTLVSDPEEPRQAHRRKVATNPVDTPGSRRLVAASSLRERV
jgi:hypothetical protein